MLHRETWVQIPVEIFVFWENHGTICWSGTWRCKSVSPLTIIQLDLSVTNVVVYSKFVKIDYVCFLIEHILWCHITRGLIRISKVKPFVNFITSHSKQCWDFYEQCQFFYIPAQVTFPVAPNNYLWRGKLVSSQLVIWIFT